MANADDLAADAIWFNARLATFAPGASGNRRDR